MAICSIYAYLIYKYMPICRNNIDSIRIKADDACFVGEIYTL